MQARISRPCILNKTFIAAIINKLIPIHYFAFNAIDEFADTIYGILSVNPEPGVNNCEYLHRMLEDIGKDPQMDIFKTPSIDLPNNSRPST